MKDLDERCREVFILTDTEEVCDADCVDGNLRLFMCDNADDTCWIYLPDMTERPEAMEYVLGNRNDFND